MPSWWRSISARATSRGGCPSVKGPRSSAAIRC
jgi:hypothetical protein